MTHWPTRGGEQFFRVGAERAKEGNRQYRDRRKLDNCQLVRCRRATASVCSAIRWALSNAGRYRERSSAGPGPSRFAMASPIAARVPSMSAFVCGLRSSRIVDFSFDFRHAASGLRAIGIPYGNLPKRNAAGSRMSLNLFGFLLDRGAALAVVDEDVCGVILFQPDCLAVGLVHPDVLIVVAQRNGLAFSGQRRP